MSFKDMAYGSQQNVVNTSIRWDQSITKELEIFQRQVALLFRTTKQSLNLKEDKYITERIHVACTVQEKIANMLKNLPPEHNTLQKQKLYKDFAALSNQLEKVINDITMQETKSQEVGYDEHISAEHDGEMIQFRKLENEVAHNETLIEERERDIHRIHESVTQVNEIFKDLASMVKEQQSAIDDIEVHIQESHDRTKAGLEQVQKAASMQRSCTIQ